MWTQDNKGKQDRLLELQPCASYQEEFNTTLSDLSSIHRPNISLSATPKLLELLLYICIRPIQLVCEQSKKAKQELFEDHNPTRLFIMIAAAAGAGYLGFHLGGIVAAYAIAHGASAVWGLFIKSAITTLVTAFPAILTGQLHEESTYKVPGPKVVNRLDYPFQKNTEEFDTGIYAKTLNQLREQIKNPNDQSVTVYEKQFKNIYFGCYVPINSGASTTEWIRRDKAYETILQKHTSPTQNNLSTQIAIHQFLASGKQLTNLNKDLRSIDSMSTELSSCSMDNNFLLQEILNLYTFAQHEENKIEGSTWDSSKKRHQNVAYAARKIAHTIIESIKVSGIINLGALNNDIKIMCNGTHTNGFLCFSTNPARTLMKEVREQTDQYNKDLNSEQTFSYQSYHNKV